VKRSLFKAFICLAFLANSVSYACLPSFDEPEPREQKIETVQGTGEGCYYKRIPQPERTTNWTEQESWRTEFYVDGNAKPVFTEDGYSERSIACVEDELGRKHISFVNYGEGDNNSYEFNPYEEKWLNFYIDNQKVMSYALIELILRPDNFVWYFGDTCSGDYPIVLRKSAFIERNGIPLYQIITMDDQVTQFDLLTGEKITTEQPLNVVLTSAVREGNLEKVREALSQGADPNWGNEVEGTPLRLAVKLGYFRIVKELINSWASLEDKKFKVKESCVSEKCTQQLLLNWEDERFDESVLIANNLVFAATEAGNFDMVQFLVENGASVDSRDFDYPSDGFAIEIAVRNGNRNIYEYLLEQGANNHSVVFQDNDIIVVPVPPQ
jgi:hypothetical protein